MNIINLDYENTFKIEGKTHTVYVSYDQVYLLCDYKEVAVKYDILKTNNCCGKMHISKYDQEKNKFDDRIYNWNFMNCEHETTDIHPDKNNKFYCSDDDSSFFDEIYQFLRYFKKAIVMVGHMKSKNNLLSKTDIQQHMFMTLKNLYYLKSNEKVKFNMFDQFHTISQNCYDDNKNSTKIVFTRLFVDKPLDEIAKNISEMSQKNFDIDDVKIFIEREIAKFGYVNYSDDYRNVFVFNDSNGLYSCYFTTCIIITTNINGESIGLCTKNRDYIKKSYESLSDILKIHQNKVKIIIRGIDRDTDPKKFDFKNVEDDTDVTDDTTDDTVDDTSDTAETTEPTNIVTSNTGNTLCDCGVNIESYGGTSPNVVFKYNDDGIGYIHLTTYRSWVRKDCKENISNICKIVDKMTSEEKLALSRFLNDDNNDCVVIARKNNVKSTRFSIKKTGFSVLLYIHVIDKIYYEEPMSVEEARNLIPCNYFNSNQLQDKAFIMINNNLKLIKILRSDGMPLDHIQQILDRIQ